MCFFSYLCIYIYAHLYILSQDDKSSSQGQHKAPTRRLIKRKPPSKMTRLATDDKSINR